MVSSWWSRKLQRRWPQFNQPPNHQFKALPLFGNCLRLALDMFNKTFTFVRFMLSLDYWLEHGRILKIILTELNCFSKASVGMNRRKARSCMTLTLSIQKKWEKPEWLNVMKLPDKSTGNLGTSGSICGCAEVNDVMLCKGGIVNDYLC